MVKKLLIVIPCYNEEAALPCLLKELDLIVPETSFIYTVLVINDCSTDNTSTIARNHGAIVLDLPNNIGIGGAVQTGIRYAKYNGFDYVMQMDGDGQHPPSEIKKLVLAALQSSADVVIGSRFIGKSGYQSTSLRRIGIKYFHLLNKLFTNRDILDSTSGYRLLSTNSINIAAKYYPDDYPEPESLVVFGRAGLNILEVPVTMDQRNGGISSIRGFDSFYYVVKVTLSMFFSYVRRV